MKWFLDCLIPRSPRQPVATDDELLVEPNARGGWSLRFAGEPLDRQVGNYPTPQDAAHIARLNVTRVRIVDTPALPALTPQLSTTLNS